MNDPHVAVLIYKIEHGDSIDYSKAKPLDHEEAGFRVKITNGQVCFKFKDHYASVDEAREAIGDYIRSWEFDAGLREGPNRFKLKFDQSQIEDRNPTPGAVSIGTPIRFSFTVSEPTVTLSPACYPPPPSGLKLTPDVQTLYDRYVGYLQGREPLTTLAYLCLTILESSTKKGSSGFLVGGQRVAGSSILPTRRRPQSHRSPKGGQEIPKYPTRQSGRGQLVKGIRH